MNLKLSFGLLALTVLSLSACHEVVVHKKISNPTMTVNPVTAQSEKSVTYFAEDFQAIDVGLKTDQTIESLSVQDQKENDAVWANYMEFSPVNNFEGDFIFKLDAGIDQIQSAKLSFNYLGYKGDLQNFKFKLQDLKTGEWITVADNSEVTAWKWSAVTVKIENPQRFIDDKGELKLKFVSQYEESSPYKTPVYLDYLSLELTILE